MHVMLDGTVLEIPLSGVSRALLGLYGACGEIHGALRITAAHRRPLAVELPAAFQTRRLAGFLSARLWRQWALPAHARRQQPDVLHFPWNGKTVRLPPNILVATTLHDVLPLEIPGFFPSPARERDYRGRTQRDLDRSHLVLTDSEYSRHKIVEHFRTRTDPVVVYCAPFSRKEGTAPGPASPAGPSYFLYVGGYHPRKGLESLLRVFISLREQRRLTSKLILTGSPYYHSAAFKELVEQGKEMRIVEERGFVPDAELARLFAGARALVYPSKYEGFGLPPLEAMAAGCPVVTTRYTAIPEICGEAALYVEPSDERDFGRGLMELENNGELRRTLIARGFEQAAKFHWDNSARVFLKALEETLARFRAKNGGRS